MSGTSTFSGAVITNGDFTNNGTTTNNGPVINNGPISNFGTTTNYGPVVNIGTSTFTGPSIFNGPITNNGTTVNLGAVVNNGEVINNSTTTQNGVLIVNGTTTFNGSVSMASASATNLVAQNATITNLSVATGTFQSVLSQMIESVIGTFTNLFASVANFGTTNTGNLTATGTANLLGNNTLGSSTTTNNFNGTNNFTATTSFAGPTNLAGNTNINGGTTTVTGALDLSSASVTLPTSVFSNIASNTTNVIASAGNEITSIVNGKVSTTTAVNSNVISTTTNTFTSAVNGIASAVINFINSLTASVSGNTLTVNVNGVSATSSVITGNTLVYSTTTNKLISTVNGVVASSTIPGTENIVEFSVNANPNTGGTTFAPNQPADADVIYYSTIDNSTWKWSGSNYVTYTSPTLNAISFATSTNVLTSVVNGKTATTSLANVLSNILCNITGSYFCDSGNTRGANTTLGTNDNFAQIFETNNTERMRITNTGNVGIGTNSPSEQLQVSGGNLYVNNSLDPLLRLHSTGNALGLGGQIEFNESDINYGMRIKHSTGGDANNLEGLYFERKIGPSYTTAFMIDQSNLKIGVGTNIPYSGFANTDQNIAASNGFGLDGAKGFGWVNNNAGFTQALYNASAANAANGLAVKITGTSSLHTILDLSTGSTQAGAGNPVMTVLGNRNVGIGTNNPIQLLHINQPLAATGNLVQITNAVTGSANTDGLQVGLTSTGQGMIRLQENGPLIFGTNATEVGRFQGNGRMGIGANNPGSLLSVNAGGTFGSGYSLFAAPANGLAVEGSVGVGVIAPGNALHVASSTGAISGLRLGINSGSATTTSNNKALSVNANGDVVLVDAGGGIASITNSLVYSTTTNKLISTVNGVVSSTTIPGTENIVEFSVNANPNTGGTTFNPNQPNDSDVIYTSTIDNSTWKYNGATYVTYTAPASTAWYLGGTANDAGSNKTASIGRIGKIHIGATGTVTEANAVLQLTSPLVDTSGLKFTNLTSLSVAQSYTGKTLSVDNNGNVILVNAAATNTASSATALVDGSALYASCTVMSDGSVMCWGNQGYSEAGGGEDVTQKDLPRLVNLPKAASKVYGTARGFYAAMQDGTLYSWGYNGYGQLGHGNTTTTGNPKQIIGLNNIVKIVTTHQYGSDNANAADTACSLSNSGTVYCWGYNGYGQVGNGNTTNQSSPVQILAAGVADLTAGGGDEGSVCAKMTDGTAKCWGYNGYGQLGDGTTTNRSIPTTVSGLTNVNQMTVHTGGDGAAHVCASLNTGVGKCWGYNGQGQLGNGNTTNQAIPVNVSGLTNINKIIASVRTTYAILSDGTIRSWGDNSDGKLGNGTLTNSSTPVNPGLANIVDIKTGTDDLQETVCARTGTGGMYCWASNDFGSVGTGNNSIYELSPRLVNISGVTDMNLSGDGNGAVVLALLNNGQVKSWGYNGRAQMGVSDTQVVYTPQIVKTLTSGGGAGGTGVSYSASNGITASGTVLMLGGLLTQNTSILTSGFGLSLGTTTAANQLFIASSTGAISGLRLGINSGTATTTSNGKVLTVNSNGDVILVSDVSGGGLPCTPTGVGSGNTCYGAGVLQVNSSGNLNSGFGASALNQNTTGNQNTAFGANTLASNIGGLQNTSMGVNSLLQNTSGGQNTGLGFNALFSNDTGSFNTGVGTEAGRYINGTNNTFIGYAAGNQDSGGSLPTINGSNNIIIGTNSNFIPVGGGSNQLNIGNIIFGTGIGSGTTISGNIGIGNSNPAVKLQVTGDIRVGTSGANGCLQNFAGTALAGTCSSDENLKTNIIELDSQTLSDKFSSIKFVSYKWNSLAGDVYKKSTDSKAVGVLAQNVQEQFPELVSTDDNGYKVVDMTTLNWYALASLKSSINKINNNLSLEDMQNMLTATSSGALPMDATSTATQTVLMATDTTKYMADSFTHFVRLSIEKLNNYFFDIILWIKKLRANEICLTDANGETCINRSQLNSLLSNPVVPVAPITAPPAPAITPEAEDVATSAEEITNVAP